MVSKRVVMPGGTGFLGTHLTQRLVERGDHVTVLTRGPSHSGDGWDAVSWDAIGAGEWERTLQGADALVHLSGKRVDCAPTRRNIAELTSSRVEPVLAIGRAYPRVIDPPPVWIQLSTLARYGEGGEVTIDETTEPFASGPPQMVGVASAWEEAFHRASAGADRTVLRRAGIAIGGSGDPATDRLVWLAKRGLGGKVGSGQQWVSWVAIEDFIDVLVKAIDDPSMTGLYHVTSPKPVRNEEMMRTYREAVGRRFGLNSPNFVTHIGARMLGSDPQLALTGRRCVPARLLEEGYVFRVPEFASAVDRAMGRP